MDYLACFLSLGKDSFNLKRDLIISHVFQCSAGAKQYVPNFFSFSDKRSVKLTKQYPNTIPASIVEKENYQHGILVVVREGVPKDD